MQQQKKKHSMHWFWLAGNSALKNDAKLAQGG